jgi:hypothetical protein
MGFLIGARAVEGVGAVTALVMSWPWSAERR